MMKRNVEIVLRLTFMLLFTFGYFFAPLNVEAAIKKGDTLASLRQSLAELQQKKSDNQNRRKLTQAEIDKYKANISNANYEIYKAQQETEEIEKQIERTNAEITEVKEYTEELLVLYQKLQSDNIYMAYITGASTMTELIMRSDMISQITDYNEEQLHELELLTENNKKLSKQLVKYEENLNARIKEYEQNVEALGDELSKIEEGAVTIDDEINSMQELIKYYQGIGCKEDQDLTECVSIARNSGWLKPVSKGVITDLFGYRGQILPNVSTFHKGVDIGVAEGTNVYPTAAGQVGAIVRRSSCGGNMLYIWTYVNGKAYTYVYMHLKEIKVNVGDAVTTDTLVALSGGKSYGYDTCTTGAHLHYGLAEGHHFGAPGDLALSKFNSYVINPPGYPGLGQWFYGR